MRYNNVHLTSDLDGFLDGAQQLVPIVDGRLILPQVDDLGQLSGHKSLGEVLIRLLSVVGGEELHQTGIEAGLFDGRYHRGAALLLLQSGQGLEEKLQSRAILDLKRDNKNLVRAEILLKN